MAKILCAVGTMGMALLLSACDTMPEVNNYNCYAHILPIDRDYHDYAAKCRLEHLGKSNKEYNDLAIARLKACYYSDDVKQCQEATEKLETLLHTWQDEQGALATYSIYDNQ